MRCPKESFIKDSYFHIYNRTLEPNKLFYERDDYIWFLKRFKKKTLLYPATVFAYCLPCVIKYIIAYVGVIFIYDLSLLVNCANLLSITRGKLPNHFHFLIRQDSDKPIYKIFNDSLSAYVRHYNYKYKRKGTLFEGHLQHKNVNNEKYLLYLCQYIHFNPKKAGLVDNLEDWKFSNFLEWIGKRNGTLFDDEILKNHYYDSKTYAECITEHEKYLTERLFCELLIDYRN